MDRRKFLLSIPFAIAAKPTISQLAGTIARSPRAEDDALMCSRKFALATSKSLQKLPINEVMVEIGRSFVGTEYVANALDVPGEERLVVNLRGLDCVSFCENVLVFARCIKKNTMTFEDYRKELQWIRYRGGVINRYPSRLHYFSDYIFDNVKKKVLKDVTEELGGVPYRKKINFMSTHPNSYRQLKENPEFIKVIEKQEEEISNREMLYLPKKSLMAEAPALRNGDIIAVTTDIEGLDVSHTGVAIRLNSKVYFMHAPDVGSKVTITDKTLADYLASHKRQTGIMVARSIEPAA